MDIKRLFEFAGIELTDEQVAKLQGTDEVNEDADEQYEINDRLKLMAQEAYGHIDQAMHSIEGAYELLDPSDSRVEDYKYVEKKVKSLMMIMRQQLDGIDN